LRPTILIVDEDGSLLQAMGGLLERCGYEVIEAESLLEARAALDECRPDLLIIDLILRGMDGREAARMLRAHVPGLRVLFVSAYAGEDSMRTILRPGEAFLGKPFSAERLLGAVERVLDGREWDEASEA
jgi:CheY-like chemotaxis protein